MISKPWWKMVSLPKLVMFFFWEVSWRIFIWCFLVGEILPFDVIVCATGFTIVCLQFEYSPNPTGCWTRNRLTGRVYIRAPWHWSYHSTILWRERRTRGLPWNCFSSISQFYMISGKTFFFHSIITFILMALLYRTEHYYWIYVCLIF